MKDGETSLELEANSKAAGLSLYINDDPRVSVGANSEKGTASFVLYNRAGDKVFEQVAK